MGPVEEIMDVVHTRYKSRNIDTIEKYYINHETSTGWGISPLPPFVNRKA
jgi:hypothetical protein